MWHHFLVTSYFIDIEFDVWSGCYVSNNIALMACFAINGYFHLVQYHWYAAFLSKSAIEEGPLCYRRSPSIGCHTYRCVVSYDGQPLITQHYRVNGKLSIDFRLQTLLTL